MIICKFFFLTSWPTCMQYLVGSISRKKIVIKLSDFQQIFEIYILDIFQIHVKTNLWMINIRLDPVTINPILNDLYKIQDTLDYHLFNSLSNGLNNN